LTLLGGECRLSESTMDANLPVHPEKSETSRAHLVRGLGLWSATAIVIGDTIGTGIFLVSSDMARAVGSASLVIVAWILGGFIVLLGALCYAELGAAFPKAGGPYVYLGRGLGPLWGFLFGWMSSFLDRPVAMAGLGAGIIRFMSFFFPALGEPLWTGRLAHADITLTVAQPMAALIVIVVTGINYFSVKMSGAVQVILTSLKIGTILLIGFGGLLLGHPSIPVEVTQTKPLGLWTISALLTALVPAMWAYNGFNDLGDLGEEITKPEKNIPRAILLGLLTVGTIYLLANFAYLHVLPLAAIAGSQHVASDAVRAFAGSRGAYWLTLAMAVSAFGALHVVVLTGARIPYAMARDRVFFQFAGRLHPRFNTPTGALFFLGTVATFLALTGTFEELYSLFIFAVWIFFALTGIALMRLRWVEPELVRPYRAWGYPWTPLVFTAAAIALTVNLWMVRPVRSTIGLGVILLGIPFYYRWKMTSGQNDRSTN
jgi:APA family basic amino acid/polyamine antiporter